MNAVGIRSLVQTFILFQPHERLSGVADIMFCLSACLESSIMLGYDVAKLHAI